MMSVPIATCTVTGISSRAAAASRLDAGVRRFHRVKVGRDRLAESQAARRRPR